jgi:hypothetical protein
VQVRVAMVAGDDLISKLSAVVTGETLDEPLGYELRNQAIECTLARNRIGTVFTERIIEFLNRKTPVGVRAEKIQQNAPLLCFVFRQGFPPPKYENYSHMFTRFS